MRLLVSGVGLMIWLGAVPLLAGLLPAAMLPPGKRRAGVFFLTGYLLLFALFELTAIPCMLLFLYDSFGIAARIYAALSLLLAAAGGVSAFLRWRREKGQTTFLRFTFGGSGTAPWQQLSVECRIYWALFAAIVLFQLYMAATRASFDGDDAYYVVQSLQAQELGVMNTVVPYTGWTTALDIRHALAVITMWIAFIAKMSGIHATILAHTILPFLLIPLTDLVYLQIGRSLLRESEAQLPVFMILLSLLQIFGNVSIYTPETFLLTRTWQGKSMTANLVIPLIFWLFLWILEEAQDSAWRTPWLLLTLVNMFAGICSSMGMLLATGLIALLTLAASLYLRKWRCLLAGVLCCLPNLVYVALYLAIG